MAKNNSNPNELDLLATGSHTFPSATYKANPIQSINSTFTFESVITKLNQPIGKGVIVYVYFKGLGTLITKTETDEDSKIYIPNLSKHNEYMVVAIDPKDIYNSVIFDITFDLNSKLFNNASLKYYNIYDVPNLQKLYTYWNTLSDQRVDPNILFFISNPNFKDDLDLIWGMNGSVKTTTIKDIRTFIFTNSSEYIYLYHNPVPPKEQFTFSAYIYIESNNRNTTTDNNIFKQATQSLYIDSNLKLNYKNTDNTNTINMVSTTSVTLDDWNHVSISFDGSKLYLFLNGVLEAWSANSLGMSYVNSTFTLGEGFKGFITQPLMTSDCKYTEDFEFLLKAFSYKPQVYSDPSDTVAEYVRLKLTSNRLGYGLRDEVNNISFNSGVKNTNFTNLNTKSRMVAYTKNPNMILGNKNFCMEMKIKVRSVTDNYPKLVLNHNESWTTNSWEFDINHISYPNTYSFHSYNVGSWAFNYPTIFNELIDLAIVREGVNLKFYVNGFLDRTINVGTNSFDNTTINTFLAIAYYINSNFYDFKFTVGHSRYTGNYQPKQLDWIDADIALDQYKIINMPFKQTLTDSQFVFTFVPYNVTLSTAVSVNNTKSAYFKNAKIVSNQKLLVTNEKFSMEMFYQPKTESLSGVASIISVSGAFRLGSNFGVLSFFNGTAWEDSTYSLDDTKLNHIVLQRDGTTIKLLADGNLVLTTTYTVPIGTKIITIGCFNDTEYIDGYINNFIVYKNITKYNDTYTVPLEDPVVIPPEAAEPEIVVTNFTTAALDFEQQYIDRIPTTTWTVGGSTANITSENKLFGNNSFETKNIGDCITLPYNHITSSSTPYTIDFYMLHIGGTKGSSRTDDTISLFSKNTSGDRYICLGDTRIVGWTLPHVKKYTKFWNNEINHYTLTFDGAASRLFVNGKLEAIGGGSMDFNSGSDPLRFGYHLVSGYDSWAFGTKGIWDNFNIHQGIATVVRDKDPHEEYLICDLAFDGGDNTTTIVDNGTDNLIWSNLGSAKISTQQQFNGYSSLKFQNTLGIKTTISPLLQEDFTISFDYMTFANFTTMTRIFQIGKRSDPNNGLWFIGKLSTSECFIQIAKNGSATETISGLGLLTTTNSVNRIQITRSNGIYNTYLNDKLISIYASNTSLDATDFYIGSDDISEGYLSGHIKNFKIYKGVAVVPKQKKIDLININVLTSLINSNYSWTTTNAILQSNSFTGEIVNTSGNSIFSFYGSDFKIHCKFSGYGNIIKEWNTNLRFKLNVNSDGSVTFNFYETGPNQRTVTTNPQTLLEENELIVQRLNGYLYIILNGVFYSSSNPFNGAIYGPTTEGVRVGSNTCTITSLNIYKEIAPNVETIELDFQDNLSDNYSNSIWTSTGLTYDTVNSIKGSSAKFVSNTVLTTKTTNMDFDSGDFRITYDIKPSESGVGGRYSLTPDLVYTDTKAIWFFGDSVGFDYKDKPTNVIGSSVTASVNQYYNLNVIRKNKTLHTYVNDTLVSTHNLTTQTFDFSKFNSGACLGKSPNFGVGQSFIGYIDNFKSTKNYQNSAKVELPAVYFPFRVNSNNIGYANNLIITATGNPTYATVNNVKCIKFESGKYITIQPHNVFNLGSNIDFYIEFDIYIPSIHSGGFGHTILNGNGLQNLNSVWLSIAPAISTAGTVTGAFYLTIRNPAGENYVNYGTSNTIDTSTWNNFKFYRKGNIVTLELNGIKSNYIVSYPFDFSSVNTYIGAIHTNGTNANLDGYMSNFIMFLGISEKPSTFDNKTVLDLDFKPTGKSYLFKDNNNKTILSPVNITQRNYLNSKYCCTFNGTNQCIMTYKNPLFNFGTEDFIMEFKFKPISTTNWNILISNGNTTSGDAAYCYIGMSPNNGANPNQIYATINSSAMQLIHPQQIDTNNINTVVFYKDGNTYTVIVNGQAVSTTVTTIPNFDLNNNNNTIIGRTNHNSGSNTHWYTGEMYSVRVFRNTSDLTLLD